MQHPRDGKIMTSRSAASYPIGGALGAIRWASVRSQSAAALGHILRPLTTPQLRNNAPLPIDDVIDPERALSWTWQCGCGALALSNTRPQILECWFKGRPIRDEYLIVDRGKLAGTGAHSYSVGNR